MVNSLGFVETVFADDLNCFKEFDCLGSDDSLLANLRECQQELHRWGAHQQVTFDPSKESFHILDRERPVGESFRLLGVLFDTKLTMRDAIMETAAQAHSRVQMVLRTRRFNTDSETFRLYKAQVLSFLEHATPAIHHATPFHLSSLDRVQSSFLEAMQLTEAEAFVKHKLAPLSTRRDIALLGFLFRFAHGLAPRCFNELFRFGQAAALPRRRSVDAHNRQIFDPIDGTQSPALSRTVYSLVHTFNSLPPFVVESSNASAFQHQLQKATLKACKSGFPQWHRLLSDGVKQTSLSTFSDFFES